MLNLNVNWLHIGALGAANFFLGFAWYSYIFRKPWMKALGFTSEHMNDPEAKKRMPILMGAAAVTAFLLSFGSQVLVQSLNAGDAASGAMVGLFVALVFVAAHASGGLFEGRPYLVYGIGVLHGAAVLTLDCAVLAAWH